MVRKKVVNKKDYIFTLNTFDGNLLELTIKPSIKKSKKKHKKHDYKQDLENSRMDAVE